MGIFPFVFDIAGYCRKWRPCIWIPIWKIAIEIIFDEYADWPHIAVSGLSNILAALGLFVVVSRSPSFLLFFTLLFFMFGVNNGWYYIGGMKDLAVGYFMWVASFFFMSVGFLCSSLKQRPNAAPGDALPAAPSGSIQPPVAPELAR